MADHFEFETVRVGRTPFYWEIVEQGRIYRYHSIANLQEINHTDSSELPGLAKVTKNYLYLSRLATLARSGQLHQPGKRMNPSHY